jgi:hypothetical protein
MRILLRAMIVGLLLAPTGCGTRPPVKAMDQPPPPLAPALSRRLSIHVVDIDVDHLIVVLDTQLGANLFVEDIDSFAFRQGPVMTIQEDAITLPDLLSLLAKTYAIDSRQVDGQILLTLRPPPIPAHAPAPTI